MNPHQPRTLVRFGVFEADLTAGEFFKQGRRVRLQGKPFDVLCLLLESPGELVTRERLRERLWSETVFVDFDTNLNTAVTRLREALGDAADSPRFIETLPRRGYRFIAEVHASTTQHADARPGESARTDGRRTWMVRAAWLALALCAGGVGLYMVLTAIATRGTTQAAPQNGRVRLAVLPFEDLTGASGHIANGLTEELITQIGRLAPDRLGVIGRTSVMRFRSTPGPPLPALGRDLRVRFIVDGSIRHEGTRMRVAVRLSQVSDETVIWADVFERDLRDGLALQIEIARAVARTLAIDVLREDVRAIARATTASSEAFDAHMRGLYELRRGTETGFIAAAGHFERAIAADPLFALAHAGWADAQLVQRRYTLQPVETLFPAALDAARRAVELDEGLAQAHAVLGGLYQFARQPESAERELRRALDLNPSLASVHEQYAWYLLETRRPDDALAALARARDLDPLSPSAPAARGYVLLVTSRPDQAEAEFRRSLAIDGAYPFAHYGLGCLMQDRRRYDDAIAAFTRAYASGSRAAKYGSALAEAYVRAGRHAEATRLLDELRDLSTRRYVPAFYLDRLTSLVERRGP